MEVTMSALHNAPLRIGFFESAMRRSDEESAEPGVVSRLWKGMTTWRNRSVMRQHLLNMNDHMLQDLGLTRSDAMREANKHVWEH
jgi:uncharacterized protein YjiS (DUF1127 family)